MAVQVEKPTSAEQQSAWQTMLGDASQGQATRLAGQFNLNRHDIAAIVVRARKDDDGRPFAERVWRGCRARTRPLLDRLAERLDTKATWDHIVLPAPESALLRQVAAQVDSRAKVYDEWGFRGRMNRGFGISALFAGESGTGKTMAAEVIANALNLDLYRIDLSAVVSKYIGETEKNLRQVFDEAEDGGAILLFDEADALFGKRSEVKDSHDRYANIEINYLLQRMEAYRGLAILATNMKSALDTAFMRRLRFVIKFPFPGAAERRLMWERAFPKGTPLGVLDYERLSKLGVTGGVIHNITLNAAFSAARAGTPVTMASILEAARTEFRKTDRPVNEADFRWIDGAEARA
jgi:SpoVK/Ycf46/Vps4 family AAA+-type ATPase